EVWLAIGADRRHAADALAGDEIGGLLRELRRRTLFRHRGNLLLSWKRALPDRVADEEGPERLEILRRLRRRPHALHDVRERMKVLADETDHEVVVAHVEAVAREADVVHEIRLAVGAADDAVLADDRPLLLRRQ